jgi:hypothetical protein
MDIVTLLSSSKLVLPSAVLTVKGNSVEVLNITDDGFLREKSYELANFAFSHINGYEKRPAIAENSFFIPIENISVVGKQRIPKPAWLSFVCVIIAAAMTGAGMEVGGFIFTVLFFVLGVCIAASVHFLVRYKWAFSIVANSGTQYLLVSKNLNFLQDTYVSIKTVIDNPEKAAVYNNISFDFVAGNKTTVTGGNVGKIVGGDNFKKNETVVFEKGDDE